MAFGSDESVLESHRKPIMASTFVAGLLAFFGLDIHVRVCNACFLYRVTFSSATVKMVGRKEKTFECVRASIGTSLHDVLGKGIYVASRTSSQRQWRKTLSKKSRPIAVVLSFPPYHDPR